MASSSKPAENTEKEETAARFSAKDILSQDDIPDENQKPKCFSCDNIMTGLYCHCCGQKNDNYRRSIWSLFSETFASIFSLENRMWRTWLILLSKPGLVAREFADGKRTLWTSPVRIYLALSIFLFGYVSLTQTRIFSIRTDIIPRAEIVGGISELDDSSVKLEPDFGFFRRQAEIDRLNAQIDFDRIARLMNGSPRQVFTFGGDLTILGQLPTDELLKSTQSWPHRQDQNNAEVSVESERAQAIENYTQKVADVIDQYNELLFAVKSPATIGDLIVESAAKNTPLDLSKELRLNEVVGLKLVTLDRLISLDQNLNTLGLARSDIHKLPIGIENGFELDLGRGTIYAVELSETDLRDLVVQILQNPAILNEGFSRYLPRIMFLMMPFAALIGLIFIRGKKNALLYDHLVHATYIHAVTFAFLLGLIVISQWTSVTGIIQVFLIGIGLYLPLSAKRMFQRGWFKTIFTSYSVAFLYALTMFIVVTMLTAQSLIQAADIRQL